MNVLFPLNTLARVGNNPRTEQPNHVCQFLTLNHYKTNTTDFDLGIYHVHQLVLALSLQPSL